jgi:FKBP-type peptidyl-prolyl cis-trans isomerase SlyD
MLIALDTVVAIDYTLKDDDGNIVDESEPGDPLFYLHGHQNIVEGL